MTPLKQVRLYRPSNGTEGEAFMSVLCYRCHKHDECDIHWRAWNHNLSDPEYPTEWRYGDDGKPTCTAFSKQGEKVTS